MRILSTLTVATMVALLACSSAPQQDTGRPQSPKEAAALNAQLALAYLDEGKLAVARDQIERALAQDASNLSVQKSAALVYERLKDDEKTLKHYRAAQRLAPDDPDLLNNYGAYLCRKGQTAEGEALLLRAVNDPVYETPELGYTNLSVCLRSAGRAEEADKYRAQAEQIKAAKRP